MPFDNEDFDWEEYDRGSIESIHVEFYHDGMIDLYFETEDGMEFIGNFDPEEAQDFIWDDLWFWAEENDIEFEKEEEYA